MTYDESWKAILKHIADQLRRLPAFETSDSVGSFWQELCRIQVVCPGDPDNRIGHRIASSQRLGRLALFSWHHDRETVLTIEDSAEKYLLWFPLSGELDFRGPLERTAHRISPGSIGMMPVLAETQCTLSGNSHVLALSVPQTALVNGMSVLVGLPVAGRVAFDDNSLSIEGGVGRTILQTLALAGSVAADNKVGEIPALTSRLEELLTLSMLTGLPHSFTDVLANQPSATAPGVVTLAEAHIRSHASDPITIDDIAKAAGCSVRTVQIAFRRFRKTTPMAFLRRFRLEQVYEALIRPEPGTTVADVAATWQFSHLSRLTARFRQIYGETPFDVLKRGRRQQR